MRRGIRLAQEDSPPLHRGSAEGVSLDRFGRSPVEEDRQVLRPARLVSRQAKAGGRVAADTAVSCGSGYVPLKDDLVCWLTSACVPPLRSGVGALRGCHSPMGVGGRGVGEDGGGGGGCCVGGTTSPCENPRLCSSLACFTSDFPSDRACDSAQPSTPDDVIAARTPISWGSRPSGDFQRLTSSSTVWTISGRAISRHLGADGLRPAHGASAVRYL